MAKPSPDDPYATLVYQWWHCSQASPELRTTFDAGWLMPPGRVLDLGCGLGTELAWLAQQGFSAVGVDLSWVALRRAHELHLHVNFTNANVLELPFPTGCFEVLLDRGCFHYLPNNHRSAYEREASRVLRPGGHLLLRACLRIAGARNDIDEKILAAIFGHWHFQHIERAKIPSDTRLLEALVVHLERA